ncbi:MAG: AraC family transcriptional regulator [Spirochaetales bacterium]|nr:AraC family transcriptional regulator [Spirochaetales bacterium]
MSRFYYEKAWKLKEHHHDFSQMMYLFDGDGTIHLGGETRTVRCPEILFIPPMTEHGLEIDTFLKTLDVKFKVHNAELARLLRTLPATIPIDPADNIKHALEEMRTIGVEKRSFYRERCQLLFSQILMQLLSHEQDKLAHRDSAAERVAATSLGRSLLAYIEDHYDRAMHGPDIAAALGFSYRYVTRCSVADFGITPLQLVHAVRIEKAKERIVSTDRELKEIAFEVGFKSIHHFSRTFKKETGMSPGAWRDSEKNEIRKDVLIDPTFDNQLYIERPTG